jgi:hypothetical protein
MSRVRLDFFPAHTAGLLGFGLTARLLGVLPLRYTAHS